MSNKTFSTVLGAAIATSLSGAASAGDNPFAARDLPNGYLQLAEAGKDAAKEMVCGEGKCGGNMVKSPSMNCGAMKAEAEKKAAEEKQKATEGKCAGMKMDPPAQAPVPEAPKP